MDFLLLFSTLIVVDFSFLLCYNHFMKRYWIEFDCINSNGKLVKNVHWCNTNYSAVVKNCFRKIVKEEPTTKAIRAIDTATGEIYYQEVYAE